MRLPLFAAVVAALAVAQETADMKHLSIPPLGANRPVALAALSIERGIEYPSIVNLSGNVEIKTPVCLPVGKNGKLVCDGEMIVRADEAVFHEDTGEIEAHGNVVVTPLRHQPKK